jgi:8-oxo-dGTP pyrophosphatase MutT (NUDIX family)
MTTENKNSVRIVLFDEKNSEYFLVVTESDDPDNFKLVGGKMDDGESADHAANRELTEEVGLSATDVNLQSVSVLANQHDPLVKRYIYVGKVARDKVNITPELATTIWVTTETIPAGENQEHIRSAVGAALASLS